MKYVIYSLSYTFFYFNIKNTDNIKYQTYHTKRINKNDKKIWTNILFNFFNNKMSALKNPYLSYDS